MSPLQIELLLHVAVRNEPIPNEDFSAQQDALAWFVAEKLITKNFERACGYEMADRGSAYVWFLLHLPLPVVHWRIPGPLDLAIPQGNPT